MTNIDFYYDKSHRRLRLTVCGHAGFAPIGQDIICSAVSFLVQTLAEYVKNIYIRGALQKKPVIILEHGYASVCCIPKKRAQAELRRCFEIIQTGFRLLAQTYPQYILLNAEL